MSQGVLVVVVESVDDKGMKVVWKELVKLNGRIEVSYICK